MVIKSLENIEKYDVVLASASPRRRELLGMLGFDFKVKPLPHVDESYPDSMSAYDVPEYLARKKARTYLDECMIPNELVITSDTVVILDDSVLGKPHSYDEALSMLHRLSGRTHDVVSGVVVATMNSGVASASVRTEVEFAPLTDIEISEYVRCCSPLDKAGAYGIQEWIGGIGISRIKGSFYNVMGLPLHVLYRMLKSVD